MTAPETIRVTADHIAKGVRMNACECPIARAITEALGLAKGDVAVDGTTVDIHPEDDPQWITCELPPAAREFVHRFDNGEQVGPFEFTVEWLGPDGVSA